MPWGRRLDGCRGGSTPLQRRAGGRTARGRLATGKARRESKASEVRRRRRRHRIVTRRRARASQPAGVLALAPSRGSGGRPPHTSGGPPGLHKCSSRPGRRPRPRGRIGALPRPTGTSSRARSRASSERRGRSAWSHKAFRGTTPGHAGPPCDDTRQGRQAGGCARAGAHHFGFFVAAGYATVDAGDCGRVLVVRLSLCPVESRSLPLSSPMQVNPFLIASFAVAALVDVLAPLLLAVYLMRRCQGRWRYWLYGLLVFLLSQGVTRVPAMIYFQTRPAVQAALAEPVWSWLFLLFAALTAGLCEEGGRWLAFRFLIRPAERRWRTALMLGAGHGGLESIGIGLLAAAGLVSGMWPSRCRRRRRLAALGRGSRRPASSSPPCRGGSRCWAAGSDWGRWPSRWRWRRWCCKRSRGDGAGGGTPWAPTPWPISAAWPSCAWRRKPGDRRQACC